MSHTSLYYQILCDGGMEDAGSRNARDDFSYILGKNHHVRFKSSFAHSLPVANGNDKNIQRIVSRVRSNKVREWGCMNMHKTDTKV